MTTECTTEERRTNPVDARLNAQIEAVSKWSALFVGALTIVLSHEIAEVLPLSETHQALALLPVTLVTMYVLLWAAARLERVGL